jgi:hypothetical protein
MLIAQMHGWITVFEPQAQKICAIRVICVTKK